MHKIKFAVVGCGHIGKRHAAMVMRNESAELVALCDILPKDNLGLEDYNVPYFSSLDTLLQSNIDFDVLNICTPNGIHAPMALAGLAANKHVVIEKPMALHFKDAENIMQLSEEKQKHVFCVMQNRYSPPSVWIKEMISSGRLGKIFMVQLNCYWNRDERYYKKDGWHGSLRLDGGTLFTQFSHFIDIMYWLFGDICNIQAKMKDFCHKQLTDFEDSGLVTFDFISGGIGCVNYSTAVWDKNLESSMTIIAENGSVKIGGQYMNEVEYCHVKDYIMPQLKPTNQGNDYGVYKGSAQNHNFVIDNVVNTLKGKEKPSTNGYEGLKVVEIINKIYALKHSNKG